jgi:hypothetical protein
MEIVVGCFKGKRVKFIPTLNEVRISEKINNFLKIETFTNYSLPNLWVEKYTR